MTEPSDAKTNHTLFRIVALATALAFGAMVASLFAVKNTPGGLAFEFNLAALIAFVVAGAVAWYYWQLVERLVNTPPGSEQRKARPKFAVFSIGLLLVGIVSFLYPMKFIPEEKRSDVMIGLLLALACITGVGFVMWQVRNFLQSDQQRTEQLEREERDSNRPPG